MKTLEKVAFFVVGLTFTLLATLESVHMLWVLAWLLP